RPLHSTMPLAGSQNLEVLTTGRSLVRNDYAKDPRFTADEETANMGLRSSIMVPLWSKSQVIGTLGLRSRRVGAFGPQEQAILERLAHQIAPAVENARLHEERVLAEEQLSHAQKMESVGRLAGGVAHDFNNLLTAIMGYSQLSLSEAPPESPISNHLQEIQQATERAADLTNQLLAFSRHQVIEPKVIDLNDLVFNLGKMLRRLIGEDIELVTLPAANLEPVKADPGQIEQVLVNLAVNARDSMPQGGKLIIKTANVTLDTEYVRQHSAVSPGRHVMLVVSDTGMGISKEVLDHIFEPFFTTKDVGKGTGLGLATCYAIVQQSGGHIEVCSESGQGTSFKVYLPVTKETYEAQPKIVDSSSSPRGKETVLLAEDEPLVRSMAATVLRDRGYEVLEASNGEEALRTVEKHGGEGIELLLTDVVMPQMGGPELAEKLHATHPNIKVLFTSGYAGDSLSELDALPTGTEFLPKPYMPETLAVKVREVLNQRTASLR
ncbi:MAG: ATP-binding protein, partial [Stenotrophomonas maltophilia]